MANNFGFSFSWKRALGITAAKSKFARETGIPTSKSGVERKLGTMLLKFFFEKKVSRIHYSIWLINQK
jgi:hypothetical protein